MGQVRDLSADRAVADALVLVVGANSGSFDDVCLLKANVLGYGTASLDISLHSENRVSDVDSCYGSLNSSGEIP